MRITNEPSRRNHDPITTTRPTPARIRGGGEVLDEVVKPVEFNRSRDHALRAADGDHGSLNEEMAYASNHTDRATPGRIGAGVDREAPPTLTKSLSGSMTVVTGTAGDDSIQVRADAGGGLTISNGTTTLTLTAAEAANLEIRAGDGNDVVYLNANVSYDVRVNGGAGDDRLTGGAGNDTLIGGSGIDTIEGFSGDDKIYGGDGNDILVGGDGHDYIEGQSGDDRINGGHGDDVLYGLDGNDVIGGEAGNDYIDGGDGADRLMGGDGRDQVIGGLGNDDLRGGAGADVLAGGSGRDALDGDAADDAIYYEEGEFVAPDAVDRAVVVDMRPTVGRSVGIRGSADFSARARSDLDAMRSLPTGRTLLADLDTTGHGTTIEASTGGNVTNYTSAADRLMTHNNTRNGAGTDAIIGYNRSRTSIGTSDPWMRRPPVVGLFHELVHAENAGRGSMPDGYTRGTKNRELVAVGLTIDEDSNPATPETQPNRNTENGFRDELFLPLRTRY